MDLFFEQIVKKKRTGLDFLRVFACIFLGLIVVMALFLFSGLPGLGFIIFVVCCIIIYFLYMLITATNLEYEYTFTNGDLDVDKIINVRSRKKLIQLNAREIEVMGSAKNSRHEFEKYLNDKETKKVYACEDKNAENVYFVIFFSDSVKKMLLFNPNQKIREGFKKYNPQKVTLDD